VLKAFTAPISGANVSVPFLQLVAEIYILCSVSAAAVFLIIISGEQVND